MFEYLLSNPLFSITAGKQRLVFWLSAILVVVLIVPDGSIRLYQLGAIDPRKLRPLIREMLKKEST